jgi:hypothetical protein
MSSASLIEMGNRVIIVMIKHESRNGVKIMIAFAPGVLRTIIQQICSADAPCFPTCQVFKWCWNGQLLHDTS